MKTRKFRPLSAAALALSVALSAAALAAAPARASDEAAAPQQQQYGALERGYRTGYSDGYQTGWRDSVERRASDPRGGEDYRRADRAYIAAYGSLEDYRDGYRQGFEAGYGEGYNRRGFNSELPAGGVRRRGGVADSDDGRAPSTAAPRRGDDDDDDDDASRRNESISGGGGASALPSDTVLRVELKNRLSTDVSQRGDRFEARVVEPSEYAGTIVAGRVVEVQRSGKVSGRSEIQLDFDKIQLPDGGWADFSAQVVEVVDTGANETGVDEVDPEGGIRGKGTTKDDAVKVGAAAGVGAIIGGIVGGGKGAAIGAAIGGGAGAGRVMTQRGKDIVLEPGQQLRIRTSGVARFD